MKSTVLANDDSASLWRDQKDSYDTRRFHHIVLSSLKSFVWLPWMDNYQCYSDHEYGRCDVQNRVVESKRSCSSKTLVVVVILVLITLMILLFLWNYKCIMIDKVCKGNREMLTPVFKED